MPATDRMPENFRKYWEAHPDEWKNRNSGRLPVEDFPERSSPEQQIAWCRRQLVKEAGAKNPSQKRVAIIKAILSTIQKSKSPKPTAEPTSPGAVSTYLPAARKTKEETLDG